MTNLEEGVVDVVTPTERIDFLGDIREVHELDGSPLT